MSGMNFDAGHAAYQTHEQPEQETAIYPGAMSKAVSVLGAMISFALVMGLGIWGYQLALRDVTDVPVIRALEGPSRVQPDDPGGQLAQHQGLLVNKVQSEGEAEGPVPQIVLAPEPIDLTQDDIVVAEVETEANQSGVDQAGGEIILSDAELKLSPEEQAELLASRLAERVAPLEPLSQEVPQEDETALADLGAELGQEVEPLKVLDPSIPGVTRSLRPLTRPLVNIRDLQQRAAIAAALKSVQSSAPVDTDSVNPGTRLVQIGAFDAREEAISEWDKVASRFADYMGGKQRLIQEASSGGRQFYRLRVVGFEDLNASRRFCAVLVAENAPCIPVLAR